MRLAEQRQGLRMLKLGEVLSRFETAELSRLEAAGFWAEPAKGSARRSLVEWPDEGTHSRLQPMIDAARTIKRHWDGILRWHDTHIANGILEGINSLVQAAKAKARGYRSSHNLKAMIYLIAGKLEILPST